MEIKIMSFNVRYKNNHDEQSWDIRLKRIVPLIKNAAPELIGFQEVLHPQLLDLAGSFDEYGHAGAGREDGKTKGEYALIFFKKSRFDLLDSGTFWLSETPETPSFGWDAVCIRICTWVRLADKITGKEFYHFNTHIDHVGKKARLKGAEMIRAAVLGKNAPAVITGDFNSFEGSPVYKIMTGEGLYDAKYAAESTMSHGTANAFIVMDISAFSPIDYIFFAGGGFSVKSYKVLVNGQEGEFSSDHYPVLVEFLM